LKLEKLIITNFKGITNKTIEPKGKNLFIYGKNGTLKTTVADAYCWILCDTDSKATKSWTPKPDTGFKSGEKTEVIAIFSDPAIELKKTFRETHNRQGELTGHTTDYFIDGGKCSTKKEFEEKILDLVPRDAWYLLDPLAFALRANWKKRRDTLISLAGESAVIEPSDELKALAGRNSIIDLKNIARTKRDELSKERSKKKVAIEELERQIPTEEAKNTMAEKVAEAEELVAKLEKDAQPGAKNQEIEALEEKHAELLKLKGEKEQEERDRAGAWRDENYRLKKAVSELEDFVEDLGKDLESTNKLLCSLKADYRAIKASEPGKCPTCGQVLPLENFEATKKEALELNIEEGKKAACTKARLKTSLELTNKSLVSAQKELENLGEYKAPAIDESLLIEIAEVKNLLAEKIEGIKADPKAVTELKDAKEHLDELKAAQAVLKAADGSKERIAVLATEEKDLTAQIGSQDKIINMCSEHISKQMKVIGEVVNGMFKLVTWKLFEEHINGDPTECCEALVNGRPFHRYASTGETLNAGLDIIRVLKRFYNADLPVMIDNAESITSEFDCGSQTLRLMADVRFDTLTCKSRKVD